MQAQANYLTILHFNDVYNIEENKTEPVGGVARFKTALDSFKDLNPLVLFSGDLFQPSLLSTAYDGEQMLKPINSLNVDVAMYGNHDFDLGVDTLTKYSKQCNFPWLLSNVKAKVDNQTLANSKETFVLHKNGLKIGFMGLAEKEWVFEETILEEEDINYESYVDCAQRLTKYLKEDEKCDFIIALTHMRNKQDRKLAAEFNGIDLILGGHDHVNIQERVNGTYVIKSGSDFVEFNKIVLKLADAKSLENKKEEIYKEKFLVEIETIHVTKAYEPNSELDAHVKEYLVHFEEKMREPVFHSSVQLETSFSLIRSSEQNFSNFFADLVRLDSGCDCALVNTGTFRSNRCFSPGVFTLGDIRLVLPWEDSVVKLRLTGEEFWKTLENSVSTYPVTDGRFLAVSGVSFTFYPNREPGNRVPLDSIQVKGQPLSLTKFYTIATKPYMRAGKDGYVILKGVECFAEESEDVHLTLKKFFLLAKDPNVVELWAKSSGNTNNDDDVKHHGSIEKDKLHLYEKLKSLIHDIVFVDQEHFVSIAPKVEGRIKMITEN